MDEVSSRGRAWVLPYSATVADDTSGIGTGRRADMATFETSSENLKWAAPERMKHKKRERTCQVKPSFLRAMPPAQAGGAARRGCAKPATGSSFVSSAEAHAVAMAREVCQNARSDGRKKRKSRSLLL